MTMYYVFRNYQCIPSYTKKTANTACDIKQRSYVPLGRARGLSADFLRLSGIVMIMMTASTQGFSQW
jgi:hypothetical protein